MEYPKFRYKAIDMKQTYEVRACRQRDEDWVETLIGVVRKVFNRYTRENYWHADAHDGTALPVKFHSRTLAAKALWIDYQQT